MARRILGIVAGFFAMLVGGIALLAAIYPILGTDRYFRPGTYEISTAAILVGFVVAILSAVLGGGVAARLGGTSSVRLLAFLFVVMGFAGAIRTITSRPDPGPRAITVTNLEAMQLSKQPHWVTFLHPMVGAAGILVGGRRRRAGFDLSRPKTKYRRA